MTGYGTTTTHLGNTTITVEIKSVNHRFLDIIPKYPRTFLFLEDKIKKTIKSYFDRGRIELHIDLNGGNFKNKTIVADWDLMDQFIQQLQTAKNRYSLKGDIPVSILTELPDLFTIVENEDKPAELQEMIISSVTKACEQVDEMRLEEGKNLIKDLIERVSSIRNMVLLLEGRREKVIEEYRLRIKKRIEEYIEDSISLDNGRIHQEIAMLSEKGDITEEITRLLSHLEQIKVICQSEDPIGRKLDFVVQEMNREANTIGSKSTDSQIGEWTVSIKSEIEKIKEQVQNIE